MAERIKDENNEVIKNSLLYCQVCSKVSEFEALAWVRVANPAGTSGNWQMSSDEAHKAVACADGGGRNHYLFTC